MRAHNWRETCIVNSACGGNATNGVYIIVTPCWQICAAFFPQILYVNQPRCKNWLAKAIQIRGRSFRKQVAKQYKLEEDQRSVRLFLPCRRAEVSLTSSYNFLFIFYEYVAAFYLICNSINRCFWFGLRWFVKCSCT